MFRPNFSEFLVLSEDGQEPEADVGLLQHPRWNTL